ncbi:hypothetical protein [Streptomyces sp. NPDC088246]|uniref:hypothetical protein n=1 Tax=Streptomyces sp. NPDC088246 TaxID=3365842 RepID=UPI0037F89853
MRYSWGPAAALFAAPNLPSGSCLQTGDYAVRDTEAGLEIEVDPESLRNWVKQNKIDRGEGIPAS